MPCRCARSSAPAAGRSLATSTTSPPRRRPAYRNIRGSPEGSTASRRQHRDARSHRAESIAMARCGKRRENRSTASPSDLAVLTRFDAAHARDLPPVSSHVEQDRAGRRALAPARRHANGRRRTAIATRRARVRRSLAGTGRARACGNRRVRSCRDGADTCSSRRPRALAASSSPSRACTES